MKPGRPSITARIVALERASLDRPTIPTGSAEDEARLYRSLGRVPILVRSPSGQTRMAHRTRFVDQAVLGALDGGVRQIVIVGAGYDARALRFATPGVRWFEVDHPATQPDKRRRVEALGVDTAPIGFVTHDLLRGALDDVLRHNGFADESALFVVEGVLTYLPRPAAADVLRSLRQLATPASRLVATIGLKPTTPAGRLAHRVRALAVASFGEPWVTRFEMDEAVNLFAAAGWEPVKLPDGRPGRLAGKHGLLFLGEPMP